jgi:hypothetical protein
MVPRIKWNFLPANQRRSKISNALGSLGQFVKARADEVKKKNSRAHFVAKDSCGAARCESN